MSAFCGLCETPLEDGYLCDGHALATAKRLDRMPKLYAALAGFLQPGGRRPELGRSRPAEAPLPVREPVFDLRGPGGMVGILEGWRSAMQADRGWGEPAVAGSIERRIVVAARGLSMNLDWIAASWPVAGDMAEEIRDLERSVLSIVDPDDPRERPRRLGHCPVRTVEGRCGAVVLLQPGSAVARCDWCGASWGPDRWLELAAAQNAEADNNAPDHGLSLGTTGLTVSAALAVPAGRPSHA